MLAGRTPRYEDLAQLRYTRMVIEESMPLFPPAHIIRRQPVADDEVLVHRIPAGSSVLIPTVAPAPQGSGAFCARARSTTPAFAYIRLAPARAFASVLRSPMAEAMIILATVARRIGCA